MPFNLHKVFHKERHRHLYLKKKRRKQDIALLLHKNSFACNNVSNYMSYQLIVWRPLA